LKQAIEAIAAGKDAGQAAKEGILPESFREAFKLLEELPEQPGSSANFDCDSSLNQLILYISSNCNMACRYCFERGSADKGLRSLALSPEMACKVVDLFFARFPRIRFIKFFGGEPLLYPKVIEQVCAHAETLYRSSCIACMPEFIVVTNGTIMDERIADFLVRYDVHVVFSLDGPPPVNDAARIYPNGAGSAERVIKNLRYLQKKTKGKQPESINAAYSSIHERTGLTVSGLLKYISDDLGIRDSHIVPVDAGSAPDLQLSGTECFAEALSERLHSDDDHSRFWILDALKKKITKKIRSSPLFCEAGVAKFAVAADGGVYPCQMFAGNADFLMGRIDEPLFDNPRFLDARKRLAQRDRFKTAPCSDCFARRLCVGCIGANLYRTGDAYRPDPFLCDLIRVCAEQVILKMVDSAGS
jgi:uncharacterized protein